jgi:hypothetical protein
MDKYDKAIEHLTKHPKGIEEAWMNPDTCPSGCLFTFCATTSRTLNEQDNVCGCLTQVRGGIYPAETEALTQLIRADDRIPDSIGRVTVESLPVFAEWQRKLDVTLNRY